MSYGAWTKAQTTAEILKQQKESGRPNTRSENTTNESLNPQGKPHSKIIELQPLKGVENLDPEDEAIYTWENLNTKEYQLQRYKEMGFVSENCQRLKMTASEVNINKGKELEIPITANAAEEGKRWNAKK